MSTIHNAAKVGEIAKNVIMPGDPLRAKFIADNFLENAKLVNYVRGELAYTGSYKGKDVTVMSSGIGIPSMGIYSYELYKYYDVENIIRIGSCGSYDRDTNVLDVILVEQSYSAGNFALSLNNEECHIAHSSDKINSLVKSTAQDLNMTLKYGNTVCTEAFDLYMSDPMKTFSLLPKDFHFLAAEMEAFALFYVAQLLKKEASCLLTVVDSPFTKSSLSSDDRQNKLIQMMELALETFSRNF